MVEFKIIERILRHEGLAEVFQILDILNLLIQDFARKAGLAGCYDVRFLSGSKDTVLLFII